MKRIRQLLTIATATVGGGEHLHQVDTSISFDALSRITPLPTWATTVPETNFTVAFVNLFSAQPEQGMHGNGQPGHGGCENTANVFGKTCGFCTEDCARLATILQGRIVKPADADVVIVSPELSERRSFDPPGGPSRLSRVATLPTRPPGKFYFVHKVSHGLAPADDCGRVWPLASNSTTPPLPLPLDLSEFCALLFRRDVIFADVDLGEHDLDDDGIASRLNGVTLPTGGWTDKQRNFRGDVMARFHSGRRRPRQSISSELQTPPPSSSLISSESTFSPHFLVWFRGKCHGGVRSKCKFHPERCTVEQTANAARHAGKVSRVRFELSVAFNGSFGRQGLGDEVRLEWAGGSASPTLNECPGIPQEAGGGDALPTDATASIPPPPSSTYDHSSTTNESGNESGVRASNGRVQGERRRKRSSTGREEGKKEDTRFAYFEAMADAWFGLCPHGDQRWNLRFLEVLSAGSIPVVMADGLGLPFSQVIAWDEIAVRIDEAIVDTRDPDKILAPLRSIAAGRDNGHPLAFSESSPRTPRKGRIHEKWDGVEALRRRSALGLAVFQTYFSGPDERARGVVASLGVAIEEGRGNFRVNFGSVRRVMPDLE